MSTGYQSTGLRSTGDWSTGNRSTGNRSTGPRSTGDRSTGHGSTGDWSTGDWSTGFWSISSYSTGHFSTEDYSGYGCFDKPCTKKQWDISIKPAFLCFYLTEWVRDTEMSDQEKQDNPTYKVTGGYLKVHDYKEAFKASWDRADKEDRGKIFNLPNFDADKFLEISGIDVRVSTEKQSIMDEVQELMAKANKLMKEAETL